MDDDFVRQVYEASYRRLVGQLYGVCGDLGEAEDVVQEAFARAIQHERKFRPQGVYGGAATGLQHRRTELSVP